MRRTRVILHSILASYQLTATLRRCLLAISWSPYWLIAPFFNPLQRECLEMPRTGMACRRCWATR